MSTPEASRPASTATWNESRALLQFLTPRERVELDRLLSSQVWFPLPGPQTTAYRSEADVLFYGGAAGGGKTDLELGLALTQHQRSILFRREATQLQGVYDRMADILGTREGFNGQARIWRWRGRQIEFGSCPHAGDERAYQGRPHDLKLFDEVCHFVESQFRFLCGWLRSTSPGQRKRVVAAGNPPTDSDGEWVNRYWAPWLDEHHPSPAKPGELRWYAMLDGKDTEVQEHKPFRWRGLLIIPLSRTFVPSRVQDNPYLMETGYEAQLQALPEPLRSQMLLGDFRAGRGDDPWQVVPTEWVRQAMERWEPCKPGAEGLMSSIGADVARGGRDETIVARRHGTWFSELLAYPGIATPDGPTAAGLILAAQRNAAPIHVDVIGIGASVYDFLAQAGVQVIAINGAEASGETDRSGRLPFANRRAALYWRLREALDPASGLGVALPPDDKLKADLCAPRWRLTQRGVLVESKEDIIKRIERSPDRGDAVVYAWCATVLRGQRKPLPVRRSYVV